MSFNQGNFLSLIPCNSKSIMVGNGALLPVSHIGHSFPPFSHIKFILKDILLFDKMVKNLVSVRKFTISNYVSITFEPFGFSVKDLDSCTLLQHRDNTRYLYPITSSSSQHSATSLVVVSLSAWHRRLGNPDPSILKFLQSR